MKRVLRGITLAAALLALTVVMLRLLFPLPSLESRTESTALVASEETALGRALLPQIEAHPGLSGIRPLPDGREAFAARVMLIRRAEAAIDAQYYIWEDDPTGMLLLDELRRAAMRGVRVRLLLDDNGIGGLDGMLAALDALETAEVRLWNPFTVRRPKALGYLFDFPRLNRRMHNKSLTVDGVISIVGGRNVGDIYFAYGDGSHYVDMDLMAAGPAAAAVGADFDRYWASGSAYPADRILPPSPDGLQTLMARAREAQEAGTTQGYAAAIAQTPLMRDLDSGASLFEWMPARLVSDDPVKGLGEARRADTLLARLLEEVGQPTESVDLVSPYFVPGRFGAELLGGLAAEEVRVRVLTNAWEATDVVPVHAGYARWRPALLAAGVELLELRAETAPPPAEGASGPGLFGSGGASLHAKSMAFDAGRLFVGSFNFDPRSGRLNTEMGLLVDSPALAEALSQALDRSGGVYRVEAGADGLTWIATAADGTEARLAPEPGSTLWSRLAVRLLGLLPIEWLL